jgi:hypothetical protein
MVVVDGDATINGTIQVYGGYGGSPADNSWNIRYIKSGSTTSATNTSADWGNGSTDANGVLADINTYLANMPTTSSNGIQLEAHYNDTGTGGSRGGGGASGSYGSQYAGGAGGSGNGAQTYGGRGGNGGGGAYPEGGGAGQPRGNPSGSNYSGGLFVMVVKGNIAGNGTINCVGGQGGTPVWGGLQTLYSWGGGGSGGGRIILAAGGNISNGISTNVGGGNGGPSIGGYYASGGGGGGNSGSVTKVTGLGV